MEGRAVGLREKLEQRPKAGKWRTWSLGSKGVLLATGGGWNLAWKAEDRGRLRAPCEGLSPAQEGDLARQEVEASQEEDDIIRCVF